MNTLSAGCQPGFRNALLLVCLVLGPVLGHSDSVHAGVLAETGQRALLTVIVTVEGSIVAPQGKRDEVIKWSTKRRFESSAEMMAEKPEQTSYLASATGDSPAMPPAYADLMKQTEACAEDQDCLMRVAMQMANSGQFDQVAKNAPRFQVWRAVKDSAQVKTSASYEDKSYSLFYISGPEIKDCVLTAPRVSPELTRNDATAQVNWDKINQETLHASAQGFTIETDAETQSSQLLVSGIGVGFGEEMCTETINGRAETQRSSTSVSVLPVGELKMPLNLDGSAPGTEVIANGSVQIDSSLEFSQLGEATEVKVSVPLKVMVSWELKAQ